MSLIFWALLAFCIVLIPAVVLHELGHFTAAKICKVHVKELGVGLPPRALTLFKRGETIYTLNWLPLGGFVYMEGKDDPTIPNGLAAAPAHHRLFIFAAGAGMNFTVAFLVLWGAFFWGPPATKVVKVVPDSPAMQAGFQTEDLLISVNGTKIDTPEIFINAARDANGQPLTVVVKRAGNPHTLTLTPLRPDEAIKGRTIGVDLDHNSANPHLSRTPAEATREVFYYLDTMFRTTLTAPAKLMNQEMSAQEARMSSAVGVSQIAGRATAFSFKTSNIFPFLLTFAIINAALGFTQLLPIPALDGGRILFVLVEIIRRKRISHELETKIHRTGMWALLTLMVFLIVYDLLNPITQLLDQ